MRHPNGLLGLLATLAAIVPASAIDVPQTRQEFVEAVASGKGAAVETLSVDRPLDAVYAVLEERAKACLDVEVTRVANVGYVERSWTDYNPTVTRVSGARAEFTLQLVHHPRAVGHTPPANGLYFMAADLRAVDEHHTEILLYRPKMGSGKITDSLKEWLAANPSPCPKLR